MRINESINKKSKEELSTIITEILTAYTTPAFGSLPKREIDLVLFDAVIKLGIIPQEPSVYDIARSLKITKSKARGLFYDYESRVTDRDKLHKNAIKALKSPILQRQGELYVLEIDNPVVADYLHDIFKQAGHASDGSFSPSLVKISLPAFVAITEKMLDEKQKTIVQRSLIKAGAPDGSLTSLLKGALKTLGRKLADEAGESCAENISVFIEPIWNGSGQKIHDLFAEIYKSQKNK
jgi:hypothetical protein